MNNTEIFNPRIVDRNDVDQTVRTLLRDPKRPLWFKQALIAICTERKNLGGLSNLIDLLEEVCYAKVEQKVIGQ